MWCNAGKLTIWNDTWYTIAKNTTLKGEQPKNCIGYCCEIRIEIEKYDNSPSQSYSGDTLKGIGMLCYGYLHLP